MFSPSSSPGCPPYRTALVLGIELNPPAGAWWLPSRGRWGSTALHMSVYLGNLLLHLLAVRCSGDMAATRPRMGSAFALASGSRGPGATVAGSRSCRAAHTHVQERLNVVVGHPGVGAKGVYASGLPLALAAGTLPKPGGRSTELARVAMLQTGH